MKESGTINLGDTIYHKLTSQALTVIEDVSNYDLQESDTIECRYRDNNGIYQSEDFYFCELTKEAKPVISYGAPKLCVCGRGEEGSLCQCGPQPNRE